MSDRVIPGNKQSAWERWELPHVKNPQQQKQEEHGRVTARQLEELQQQAYNEAFQKGREEGFQAGFNQGLEQGQAQGLDAGKNQIETEVMHLHQLMRLLSEPLAQINKEVREELVHLAIAVARQIIRREIRQDPGQIMAVIKESLSALPSGARKIRLFLHPDDAGLVRSHFSAQHEQDVSWNVVEDPAIARGGCRVETDFSVIDATIDKRVAEIAAVILGSERNRETETSCQDSAGSDSTRPMAAKTKDINPDIHSAEPTGSQEE